MRRGVIVLGMHRSGTSALAGVLAQAGAVLPKNLMKPSPENERGFFESTKFCKFHDKFLESVGSSWRDWRQLRLNPSSEETMQFSAQARKLLAEEFGGADLFLLKDPRMCRLMPLWLNVLEDARIEPRIVITLRSPFEVAESLKARNGFEPEISVLLWLQYLLSAERDTRGRCRCFTSMEQLLADWRVLLSRVAAELNLEWPAFDAGIEERVTQFLSRELKHHNSVPDRKNLVFAWAMGAFDAFLHLTRDPSSIHALNSLDAISSNLEKAYSLFEKIYVNQQHLFSNIQSEIISLKKSCADLEDENNIIKVELEEMSQRHSVLSSERDAILQELKQAREKRQPPPDESAKGNSNADARQAAE